MRTTFADNNPLHNLLTPNPTHPTRRQACAALAGSALVASLPQAMAAEPARPAAATAARLALPPLPYAVNALDPVLSATTLETHWGKHHKAYLDNLSKLLAGTPMEALSLQELIRQHSPTAPQRNAAVFNNAAQAWNHQFYWESLKPLGGGKPPAAVLQAIQASPWQTVEALRAAMVSQAVSIFGSGWLWLCVAPGTKRLVLQDTFNADTPAKSEALVPLAVIDVWEHAYYIDYRNKRKDYVEAVVDKLLDWGRVEARLAAAAQLPAAPPPSRAAAPIN